MPVSMLPLAVTFMMSDRAGNIDNIKFNFGDHECDMTWDEGDERNTVCCGMDGRYRYGTMTLGKIKFKICANAEWIDDINLKVMVRPVETVGMRTLNFLFRRNNKVTITPASTPSTYKIVDTLSRSFTEIIKIRCSQRYVKSHTNCASACGAEALRQNCLKLQAKQMPVPVSRNGRF